MAILLWLLETRQSHRAASPGVLTVSGRVASLSTGEVGSLGPFAQASIMLPEVRSVLRRGWGLCGRHAAGWLVLESALRHRYLHGPAVLYADLMDGARAAFEAHGPLATERVAWHLAARGPCHLCEMDVGADTAGFVSPELLRRARDASGWIVFLVETRALWVPHVCGCCAGDDSAARCRQHLVDDIAAGRPADLPAEAARVRWIATTSRSTGNGRAATRPRTMPRSSRRSAGAAAGPRCSRSTPPALRTDPLPPQETLHHVLEAH